MTTRNQGTGPPVEMIASEATGSVWHGMAHRRLRWKEWGRVEDLLKTMQITTHKYCRVDEKVVILHLDSEATRNT